MGNVTAEGKPSSEYEEANIVNHLRICTQPGLDNDEPTCKDDIITMDVIPFHIPPAMDVLAELNDDDDLRVLAEMEVLNAVSDKQALDCEALLEVLAAESEQEFRREVAVVQDDLRNGMTTAIGEDYDHGLVQALKVSAHTFEQERTLLALLCH